MAYQDNAPALEEFCPPPKRQVELDQRQRAKIAAIMGMFQKETCLSEKDAAFLHSNLPRYQKFTVVFGCTARQWNWFESIFAKMFDGPDAKVAFWTSPSPAFSDQSPAIRALVVPFIRVAPIYEVLPDGSCLVELSAAMDRHVPAEKDGCVVSLAAGTWRREP
jgi:hypothetical protein